MDLAIVPDPVFWATVIATLVPFVTALLVRLDASPALKATVATILTAVDALLVSWKTAVDAGATVDLKTLVVALVAALTWQRVVHTQVNVPYRVREHLLPASGLP
jgi:hypothetical protein